MKISAHEATVKTASVEIKSLTVQGKQVTLSVFRQLQKEDVIDRHRGKLKGEPWGTVNYFWKDCGWYSSDAHTHVVWQKGEELRRACVEAQPNKSGVNQAPINEAEALLARVLAYQTIKYGWKPSSVPQGGERSIKVSWSQGRGETLSCRDTGHLFDIWRHGPEKKIRIWEERSLTYGGALTAEVFPDGTDSYDYDEAVASINYDLALYHEARNCYDKSFKTLRALDQLFIAV